MKLFLVKNRKKLLLLLGIMIVFSVFLFIPETTYASWAGTAVAKVIGFIISPIIWLFGQLVIMLLNILIKIAQYNDFIHSSAVTYGWTLVRDLCNMFFVLILLVIAFATILRVESYNLKALLPKLIIMAILINFSKLICGIFIDFAQVIMLTFINAVKDIAGANLTHMLGISEILTANQEAEVSALTVVGSLILALVMVIIATMVILTILLVLVMRIIMIWIYVVLSPLAYLLASFPQGKSYSERWWSEFSKNLIIGPVLAFFLWLSFASLGGTSAHKDDVGDMAAIGKDWGEEVTANDPDYSNVGITQAGSMDNMIKFIISIGMLLGGLMIAQEMGGHAGKIAGKGMGQIQAMGTGALKRGKRLTGIQRVEDAYKARKQMKDSKRSDRAQMDAGRLAAVEGRIKKGVSEPFRSVVEEVDRAAKGALGVKKQEEAIKDKEAEIKGIKDMDISGNVKLINEGQENIKELNSDLKTLEALKKERPGEADEIDKDIAKKEEEITEEEAKIKELKASVVEDYNKATGENVTNYEDRMADEFGDKKAIKAQKDNEEVREDYAKLSKKKRVAENIGKITSATIGAAVAGVLTGGLGAGVGAIAGAGAAGAGLGMIGRQKIRRAGEDDLDLASSYNASQISKQKERYKGMEEDELRRARDDYSLDSSARTAIDMILMERRDLSQNEAKEAKDKIAAKYSYDGRVLDQLDASLARNYQQLSRLFTNLNSSAPPKVGPDTRGEELKGKHKKAQEKIVKQIIHNEIHMDSINDQKSIDLIMPELADVMDKGNFKAMYDRQTNEKQDQIKLSLNNTNISEARAKLGIIKKSTEPVNKSGNRDEIMKYLNSAKAYQFQDLTKSQKGVESLIKSLKEVEKFRELKVIADRGGDDLTEFRKKFNQEISKKAQLMDSPIDRGTLRSIRDALQSSSD